MYSAGMYSRLIVAEYLWRDREDSASIRTIVCLFAMEIGQLGTESPKSTVSSYRREIDHEKEREGGGR